MHAFWGFGFSSEEDSTNLETPAPDAVAKKGYETPPSVGSLPWQKSRSWANSVLESFRVDTRGLKSPGEEDLSESSSLEAFRSLTRRAHQLLARQQHRALVSRRAAAHENSYATERLSLALAEAEELEEVLKQHSRAVGGGEDHGSPSDMLCDAERLTMSGWSTSAASSATKPTELLCRWESEDADARQELEALRAVMSQTAGELRSGLLRLSFSSPDPGDMDASGSVGIYQVLSAALPQLVQSCADAMEAGSSEDDWAGAEASLFEELAQVTSATCDTPLDLDFQLQEDSFLHVNFSSPEEQRDHGTLQKLLRKLEALSQRLELEAAEAGSAGAGQDGQPKAPNCNGLAGPAAARLADLEAQVQRLVAENQSLEEQLETPQSLPQRVERPMPSRDAGREAGVNQSAECLKCTLQAGSSLPQLLGPHAVHATWSVPQTIS